MVLAKEATDACVPERLVDERSSATELVPACWCRNPPPPGTSGDWVRSMNTLCLLTEPLIRVQGPSGEVESLSLPQLLARLAGSEALDFPMLRPHQQPAWHAFLVQLAYLALEPAEATEWTAGVAVPTDATTWERLLRALTTDYPDDAPWCLVVDDWQQPAFLQSPCLPGAQPDYKRVLASAQEIDLLITSKNHDEKIGKMTRIGAADADLVAFALVSLQGFAGYLGAGNFNTMRMNGGFASRAQFRMVFERGSGPEFMRDLRVLLARTDRVREDAQLSGIGTALKPHRLVWLSAWGDSALSVDSVHPLCLEVCRRIRLRLTGDALQALTASSKTARVDAKLRNGVVLDPWLPIVRKGTGKALTAIPGSFGYRLLSPVLFDAKRFKLPVLAMPCAEVDRDSAGVLVMQVLVGGSGRTDGLLRREIPVRRRALRKFSDAPAELALRAGRFIEIASAMQGKVLRAALLQFVDGSDDPDWKNGDFGKYVQRWTEQFDQLVDEVFYEALFATVDAEQADLEAEAQWLQTLNRLATVVFQRALEALPSRDRSRVFASVRAEQMLRGSLHKQFGPLLAHTRATAGTGQPVDAATAATATHVPPEPHDAHPA